MIEYETLSKLIPESIKLILLKTVNSTNDYAKALSKDEHTKNIVIIAKEQTKGKGTKERSFYSPVNEGLYLSYLFHTKASITELNPITPAAAVAVARVVERLYSLNPMIKWVNDIELNGKKLCGILTESVHHIFDNSNSIIIGIGLNTNTKSFPEDIVNRATSLAEFVSEIDINILAAAIINEIDYILNSSSNEYMNEYIKRCSTIGKEITFTHNNIQKTGFVTSISKEGHLIVKCNNDSLVLFSGDVTEINNTL